MPTPLEWGIDPELLLILFIAPLHFNESRHVDSGALWKNRWGIASLSVGLVFAIVAACGATLHALLPAVPLAAACALGGAMGSTDAVAVTALTHDRRFGRRHEALLKGEALFNDVTGTVVFQCCLTILATGSFSLLHAGEEFALDLFGGFFGGLVMGLLAWGLLQVLRRTGLDNPTLHVMLELLLPFVIYLEMCIRDRAGGSRTLLPFHVAFALIPPRRPASDAVQLVVQAAHPSDLRTGPGRRRGRCRRREIFQHLGVTAVSYTHLDVYKRQLQARGARLARSWRLRCRPASSPRPPRCGLFLRQRFQVLPVFSMTWGNVRITPFVS